VCRGGTPCRIQGGAQTRSVVEGGLGPPSEKIGVADFLIAINFSLAQNYVIIKGLIKIKYQGENYD
jgi:hypothetical protein